MNTRQRKPDRAVEYIRKKQLYSVVADACGIKRQAVFQWYRVPPLRVIAVAKAIDWPRHKIRPDLYPEA